MATEVAQIPAEETPAVAAAAAASTENAAAAEQAEKPAAEPVAAAAAAVTENAAAAAAVANNAQDNNKEDAKASPAEAAADGAAAAAASADGAKKDGGDASAAAAAAPAKSEAPAQKFNVHKTNFEKDIIYLYQFSRTPLLPSLSPYCLKVETWLRLVGLKYEVKKKKIHFHRFSTACEEKLARLLNIFKFLHDFPFPWRVFHHLHQFFPLAYTHTLTYVCIHLCMYFCGRDFFYTHELSRTHTPSKTAMIVC